MPIRPEDTKVPQEEIYSKITSLCSQFDDMISAQPKGKREYRVAIPGYLYSLQDTVVDGVIAAYLGAGWQRVSLDSESQLGDRIILTISY